MKAITKVMMFDNNGDKFFGEGPATLLNKIEEKGSLRMAAQEMGMAYTKALKIMKNAEESLGFKLTDRIIGGKDGGGSRLTDEGRKWLSEYEEYSRECIESNRRLFVKHFGNVSCVILASGIGSRFGGNKLMAELNGKTVISYILDSTEGIFCKRVVVTRDDEIRRLCEERGIDCICHNLPGKNDSVRLGTEAVEGSDGCMFCQADQPLIASDTVLEMAVSFTENKDFIYRLGGSSPVIFPEKYFGELKKLPYDEGGNAVIQKYTDKIRVIQSLNEMECYDIDTREDLDKIELYIKEEMHVK